MLCVDCNKEFQEQKYTKRGKTIRCQSCLDQRVVSNRSLVYHVVKKLMRSNDLITRLGFDDAISAGMVGLVKAAGYYDPSRAAFSTYAYRSIKHNVVHASLQAGIVNLPTHRRCGNEAITQATSALSLSVKEYLSTDILRGSRDPLVRYDDDPLPNEEALKAVDLIDQLTNQQQKVIRLVFLKGQTLRRAGAQLGLSMERVRQIRNQALAQLRLLMEA